MRLRLRDEAEKAVMLARSSRRPVVVTHWDMDGVASAIAASWALNRVAGFYIPPFTYRVTGRVLEELGRLASKADLLVITDLAYPGPVLDRIQESLGIPVVVVDHHYQESLPASRKVVYYNPAYAGDPEGRWPSAAHVAVTLFKTGAGDPLLLAASIAGDLGEAAVENSVYQEYMRMARLDPVADYPLIRDHCVKHVDGAATMGERGALINAIKMSVYYGEPPCTVVMKDHVLATLAVQAEVELESLASKAEPLEERAGGRILVYRIEGEGLHASRLARILARRHRGRVVVVAYTSRRAGQARVYARLAGSTEPPLYRVAECLKSMGYSAGGKTQPGNNVAAVEVDPEEAGGALELVAGMVEGILAGRDPCKGPHNPPPQVEE